MQHVDRMIGVAAVALSVVALPACSTRPTTPIETADAVSGTSASAKPVAPHPPPPRRAEIPPPAPSPQALWRFGNWSWNGVKYVWVPGRYIERPSPTANWIPGYWQQTTEGWTWIEDQWTS